MSKAEDQTAGAAPPAAAPITETPEFKAALADATKAVVDDAAAAAAASVRDLVATEIAKIMAIQQPTKPETAAVLADSGSLREVLSDLAFAIAQTNDPDHGRKLIAPVELERRKAALEKMGGLLLRVQKDKTLKPMYDVHSQCFLDERMIQPQFPGPNNSWLRTRIIWRGAPSKALRPANAIAQEIFDAYLITVGGALGDDSGARTKPTWVSPAGGGLVFVSDPPQTVSQHGLASSIEPLEIGADLRNPSLEITSTDDLNAAAVPILGSIAAPARVTGRDPAVVNLPRN